MNINGLTKSKIQEFELLLKQANEEQLPHLFKMLENEFAIRRLYNESSLFDEDDKYV